MRRLVGSIYTSVFIYTYDMYGRLGYLFLRMAESEQCSKRVEPSLSAICSSELKAGGDGAMLG